MPDHPGAYRGEKELAFLSAVPASWDETHVLDGRVGERITVARRRGPEWFIGSLTDWNEREVEIPLEFLAAGPYVAEIYADAPDAAVHPKHTVFERKQVSRSERLKVRLATGGGSAIRLYPAR